MKPYHQYFKNYSLGLGKHYKVKFTATGNEKECIFIKVTRKGFNLLDIETNKCIVFPNFYCHRWAYMDIPPAENKFIITVNTQYIESITELKDKDKPVTYNAYEVSENGNC